MVGIDLFTVLIFRRHDWVAPSLFGGKERRKIARTLFLSAVFSLASTRRKQRRTADILSLGYVRIVLEQIGIFRMQKLH